MFQATGGAFMQSCQLLNMRLKNMRSGLHLCGFWNSCKIAAGTLEPQPVGKHSKTLFKAL